jgi:hypothetical protein
MAVYDRRDSKIKGSILLWGLGLLCRQRCPAFSLASCRDARRILSGQEGDPIKLTTLLVTILLVTILLVILLPEKKWKPPLALVKS